MKKDLITLKNISKTYPNKKDREFLFKDMSFSVKRSEFVAIFGPNGCGKTTLLNIIAGLDKDIKGICERAPHFKVSFIFQNYRESLFPWLTVKENISFPLVSQGASKENVDKEIINLCSKLNISVNLDAYPYTLSGGQLQIVSILRALITKPDLLLMDEPFSALDYETTLFLIEKIQDIWKKTGVAIVFVSHEVDDAVSLAERIVVLGRDPTSIVSEIKDNLPYPRIGETMNSEDFHHIKNKVLSAFLKGYKKLQINN
jgi:NitT/TauT family transport system ATP-binding protein